MIAFIVTVALIAAATAVAFVVLASVGARQEPYWSLPVQAPGPLTGLVRHILGLHVSRPYGHSGAGEPGTSSWRSAPGPPGWY